MGDICIETAVEKYKIKFNVYGTIKDPHYIEAGLW